MKTVLFTIVMVMAFLAIAFGFDSSPPTNPIDDLATVQTENQDTQADFVVREQFSDIQDQNLTSEMAITSRKNNKRDSLKYINRSSLPETLYVSIRPEIHFTPPKQAHLPSLVTNRAREKV